MIAGAVDDANDGQATEQVRFVDVTPYYNNGNHHWCENPNGEFHEPDASRDETWFFLSGWSDVKVDDSEAVRCMPF